MALSEKEMKELKKEIKKMLKIENEIVNIIETDLDGSYSDDIIVEKSAGGNLHYTPLGKYETYNELPEEEKDKIEKAYFNLTEAYSEHLVKNGLDGIGEIKTPIIKIENDILTIEGNKKIKFNGYKIKADNETHHNRFMNVDKKILLFLKRK